MAAGRLQPRPRAAGRPPSAPRSPSARTARLPAQSSPGAVGSPALLERDVRGSRLERAAQGAVTPHEREAELAAAAAREDRFRAPHLDALDVAERQPVGGTDAGHDERAPV